MSLSFSRTAGWLEDAMWPGLSMPVRRKTADFEDEGQKNVHNVQTVTAAGRRPEVHTGNANQTAGLPFDLGRSDSECFFRWTAKLLFTAVIGNTPGETKDCLKA
jgi:hypothetical protein